MNFHSSSEYISRRSPVPFRRGAVATSQPLATDIGLSILKKGGNAADAAIASAAALQVTQPCSTGLGGDCFVLYYEASSKKVHALNGSGRSAAALSIEKLAAEGISGEIPAMHPYTVTVPGAPAAWCDFHARFGQLPFHELMAPSIRLAAGGFPVSPLAAGWWKRGAETQLSQHEFGGELMIDGRGPEPGDIIVLPELAESLETIATHGSAPFYTGRIAQAIVDVLRSEGAVMELEDLAAHRSEWVEPISTVYRGIRIWECPPNGQGLAALLALGALDSKDLSDVPYDTAARYHLMIECMRMGFADAAVQVADPDFYQQPLEELLSDEYSARRGALIGDSANPVVSPGIMPKAGSDTVYFCTSDGEGNGCSFINSNYMGFGTGIVPRGCGFTLQNRGAGFSLDPNHANRLEGKKRPYHTIIPGCATDAGGDLYAVFGVMGGMMQPQGHLQVVSALVDDETDPQSALDRPRFQLENGSSSGSVLLEDSASSEIFDGLRKRGHDVVRVSGVSRSGFGLGQIIRKTGPVYWAGSDSRGDGCALGLA